MWISADLALSGQYLFQSHESSRDFFQNTCAELDLLVDLAVDLVGRERDPRRRHAGAVKRLHDIDVAEPGDDALIQQRGLERGDGFVAQLRAHGFEVLAVEDISLRVLPM